MKERKGRGFVLKQTQQFQTNLNSIEQQIIKENIMTWMHKNLIRHVHMVLAKKKELFSVQSIYKEI